MQHTREQLKSRYQQLPDDIKDALAAVETVETIKSIGQNYHLQIDELGELADEIGLVMLGLVKSEDFVTHIIARLGLDRVVADAIVREVNEQIFLKIRESLQALPEAPEAKEAIEAIGGVEPIPGPAPSTALGAGDLPDRDEIIDDIEHPKTTPEDTVFEQKMGKLFRIPREEVDLDPYLEKPGNK